MADADDHLPCRFRWYIVNLFVPQRSTTATFYNASPTPTQWQVRFVTEVRQGDSWPFTFSLTKVTYGEGDQSILADELRVRIQYTYVYNTYTVASVRTYRSDISEAVRRRMERYSFSPANQYTFHFTDSFLIPIGWVKHLVTIEIQLSFPGENAASPRHELVPRECDLNRLSDNLGRLVGRNRFFSLILMSMHPHDRKYKVHSYIIRARWSNFFSVHPEQDIVNNTVEVNISNYILRQVLLYVYAGVLDTDTILQNLRRKTEWFQVIDWYKMQHLYKVFVVDDSRQMRRTTYDMQTHVEMLRLDASSFGDRTFRWRTDNDDMPGDSHTLAFEIQFKLIDGVPSFYYSLRSRYPSRRFLHVKLDLKREEVGFYTVHGRDYAIDTYGTIGSGICRFEGDHIDGYLDGIFRGEIQRFLRCTLFTSGGTAAIEIQDIESGIRLQDNMERLRVLSDHMYELYANPTDSDLPVTCAVELPENDQREVFRLHRDIFTARVPRWLDVLDVITTENGIPVGAKCSMSREAFTLIAKYIYSGKLFPIPAPYLAEMYDFAYRGRMPDFCKFIEPRLKNLRNS